MSTGETLSQDELVPCCGTAGYSWSHQKVGPAVHQPAWVQLRSKLVRRECGALLTETPGDAGAPIWPAWPLAGRALSAAHETERYLWSVTPCLMAWPAVTLAPGPGSLIVGATLGIVYAVDSSFAAKGLLPSWCGAPLRRAALAEPKKAGLRKTSVRLRMLFGCCPFGNNVSCWLPCLLPLESSR